jgi:hypothetical protein
MESPYYTAFVKFGQHCVSIRAINFINYTDWLLKHNKKIDHWCRDVLYDQWMMEYLRKEAPQDALERAMKEMTQYADEYPEMDGFGNYFLRGNANRICHHISSGRISPWIVFNCDSGVEFLGSLNEEQMAMIMPWINPDYWGNKLKNYSADTEWCRHILGVAGL